MHVNDAVDLRPSRPAVRLEKEDFKVKSAARSAKKILKVMDNSAKPFCCERLQSLLAHHISDLPWQGQRPMQR